MSTSSEGKVKRSVRVGTGRKPFVSLAPRPVRNERPPLGYIISQKRRWFGRPYVFRDIDYSMDKVPGFPHHRVVGTWGKVLQGEMGFQASAPSRSISTQTQRRTLLTRSVQTEPNSLVLDDESVRELRKKAAEEKSKKDRQKRGGKSRKGERRAKDEETHTEIHYWDSVPTVTKEKVLESKAMTDFLDRTMDRMVHQLQMNETMDIFKDEFACFDSDDLLGNRAEHNLREINALSVLSHSKNSNISHIAWHPGVTGVVLFACSNGIPFDRWVEVSGKVVSSKIFVWVLRNLLAPKTTLAVPGDIKCFQINPHNPDLVVGGLETGQIILWDLSQTKVSTTNLRKGSAASMSEEVQPAADEKALGTTGPLLDKELLEESSYFGDKVDPTVISVLERSHGRPVTDVHWMPVRKEITSEGRRTQNKKRFSYQVMSVGADGAMMFWDIRSVLKHVPEDAVHGRTNSSNVLIGGSKTHGKSGHLAYHTKELRWLPLYRLALNSPMEIQTPVCVNKIAHGDASSVVCATEDGELCVVDWAQQLDTANPTPVSHLQQAHVATCVAVLRSPHFPDIFMTVGDWTFSLWSTEDLQEPVFTSAHAQDRLTCAAWSPTRPSVIVVGRHDGVIDVWDMLDETHKCSVSFKVANKNVSCLQFWSAKASQLQYLAAGDVMGKLHILEVPRSLRHKLHEEERKLRRNFYGREMDKVRFVRKREEQESAAAAGGEQQQQQVSLDADEGDGERKMEDWRRKNDSQQAADDAKTLERLKEGEFQRVLEGFKDCVEQKQQFTDEMVNDLMNATYVPPSD